MKKLFTAILVSGLLLGVNEVSAHGRHAKQGVKTVKQKSRIHQGVRTGQLTAFEVRQLKNQQRTIRAMKTVARADGRMTKRERVVINRAQRNASRSIYRMKNNRRVR